MRKNKRREKASTDRPDHTAHHAQSKGKGTKKVSNRMSMT